MSIDRWMDKEAVVHIYNGISLSHKRNTWVLPNEVAEPRDITQTEVSQKEQDKYHILMRIYGI